MEKDGVLSAERISSCVSHLRRFGTGPRHFRQHLSLPRNNLRDVSILSNYVHVQKLELPYNRIKDLSCVSHMPFLIILDAAHNELSDFFGFQPPRNLKEVNFSHNRMRKMKDLSDYSSLAKLNLDHNSFSEISGLEHCCRLAHLSLAHNKISRISGLNNLPLKHLCLRGNQLEKTEGLESLNHLLDLDLSLNRITSISGFQNLQVLGSINLENNLISEIHEFKKINDLFLLRDLNLLGNPVQEQPDYRLSILFLLQHLTVLDQEQVTAEEKVSAVNTYQPPLEVVAARDHMTNLTYQMMQPQVLYDSTLPDADFPYAMLVLSGPQACGKRELVYKLCEEFSEHFSYGVCHTTRGPYAGEENGHDYHFVTEKDFQNMTLMGKFVQTMQYGGHSYGLSRDTIEDAARDGLACCVHMELEGVLSLKNSYFEPRYILLIPTEVGRYRERLKDCGLYTPAQIDTAVERIELYANTNRQRPGFFDNVIPCDDCEEAYRNLRHVVREYLLPEEEGEQDLDKRESTDEASTASGQLPEEKPPSALSRSGSASRQAPPLSLSHLYYRNYSCKIRAELRPQQSTIERASVRRREQLVREAVVGKTPGVCSHLFKSLDESCASSAKSVLSSAGVVSGEECTSESLKVSSRQSCDRPGSSTDHVTVAMTPCSDRRPGSTTKPLLPPIPTGRKTPAVLSPAPSPSPNPAIHEG